MSNLFDFSKVEAAKTAKFLTPGMWTLTPTSVEFESPENGKPRINITFSHKDGGNVKDRFFLTPGALVRLQYLHEAWFGKKLEKAFSSAEQIGEYFKKALLQKPKAMPMIVGGEEAEDGRVYARLPFTGFIVTNEDNFSEGSFDETSARYKDVVKKRFNVGPASDSALLPSVDTPSSEDEDDSDMPW